MFKAVIDKLSSYNLFNYLLPGVLFSYLVDSLGGYSIIRNNLVIDVFIFYFIGLTASRVGSLFVEPLLKKIGFLKFAEYNDFVTVSAIDPKLEILSESNNMYRTVVSVFLLLAVVIPFRNIIDHFKIPPILSTYFIILIFIGLFAFSYKKQTQYITKRITKKINEISTKG